MYSSLKLKKRKKWNVQWRRGLKKEERRRKKKEERRRVFFILSLIFERRFYTINIELSRKIGKPKIKEVSGAFRQEFEGVGKMFLKRGGGETHKNWKKTAQSAEKSKESPPSLLSPFLLNIIFTQGNDDILYSVPSSSPSHHLLTADEIIIGCQLFSPLVHINNFTPFTAPSHKKELGWHWQHSIEGKHWGIHPTTLTHSLVQ